MKRATGHSQSATPHRWLRLAAPVALLAAIGCPAPEGDTPGGSPPPPQPQPATFTAPASVAGHLMWMNAVLTFLPCGEGPEAVAIQDTPDGQGAAVLDQLGGGDRPIPALVRLRGETLVEIRHAAPEGGSCDRLPGSGLLNALGNEPFWSLQVAGDSALLRTPDDPEGQAHRAGRWSPGAGGDWRFEVPGDLRLELTAVRCLDGMSGAWFPFRAVLRLGERQLEGCALEGRDAGPT